MPVRCLPADALHYELMPLCHQLLCLQHPVGCMYTSKPPASRLQVLDPCEHTPSLHHQLPLHLHQPAHQCIPPTPGTPGCCLQMVRLTSRCPPPPAVAAVGPRAKVGTCCVCPAATARAAPPGWICPTQGPWHRSCLCSDRPATLSMRETSSGRLSRAPLYTSK